MIEPGKTCPTCEERKPFPKGPASPPSKKMGYWLPADEKDAHDDVLEMAARHLGVHEQPYWEFKTTSMALALVLQDESLKGFGHREPVLA